MSGAEAATIGPLWEAIKASFCFCCARADYFDDLQVNLGALKNEMHRLVEKKRNVETRIMQEKKPHMQTVDKVTEWLQRANRSQEDAEEIMKEGQEEIQYRARRWLCPKHCCSYTQAGKRVSAQLKQVEEVIKDGDFDVVVERRRGDVVTEFPLPEIVGMEKEFGEIWKWIEDPSVRIIGLYGTGGVGKTTLLKMIYNKISSTRDYVVIWVEKSGHDPVKSVQEAIREKFDVIPEEIWKNEDKSDSVVLWNLLKSQKFVLLLDDIQEQWHYHLLEAIGVPSSGKGEGSKVIITTRSKGVCEKMRAKSIEIKCLPPAAALELFQLRVGENIINAHPEIPKLARDAAAICKGLPLLLTTIGRAMATKTNFRDWKLEVEKLKANIAEFENVESHVFSVLKVSYDTLSTDALKMCFLYFSLFPEGVKKEELIQLWIAEGFLSGCNNVYDAQEEGEDIIASLKLASLLESETSKDFVKMHDAIHAMALWLACEEGKAKDRVLVQDQAREGSKWVNAERVSLRGPSISTFPQTSCHHLTTLLLGATNLDTLPSHFFKNMPALRVLDLSGSRRLAQLPEGIGQLTLKEHANQASLSLPKLSLRKMEHLERFEILNHPTLAEVEVENGNGEGLLGSANYPRLSGQECFCNLGVVSISNCKILNMNWLIHAPNLQTLELIDCCELDEVISGDFGDEVFSKLVDLSLKNLPKLESIYHQDLEFPSLASLRVDTCPRLVKLPFGPKSAANLKEIKGEKGWWQNLQRKSKAIEDVCSELQKLPPKRGHVKACIVQGVLTSIAQSR